MEKDGGGGDGRGWRRRRTRRSRYEYVREAKISPALSWSRFEACQRNKETRNKKTEKESEDRKVIKRWDYDEGEDEE